MDWEQPHEPQFGSPPPYVLLSPESMVHWTWERVKSEWPKNQPIVGWTRSAIREILMSHLSSLLCQITYNLPITDCYLLKCNQIKGSLSSSTTVTVPSPPTYYMEDKYACRQTSAEGTKLSISDLASHLILQSTSGCGPNCPDSLV